MIIRVFSGKSGSTATAAPISRCRMPTWCSCSAAGSTIVSVREIRAILRRAPSCMGSRALRPLARSFAAYLPDMKSRYYGRETSTSAMRLNTISPYDVVRRINDVIARNAIVVGDTGAAVRWLHQAFKVKEHTLFTAGGNSPMGYGLPAAIGAKLAATDRQVVSYNGDGGFQLNIQELQRLKHYDLDVAGEV